MNSFEEELSKSLVEVIEDRNIRRENATIVANEAYNKLKLIYDNVKESFNKRGITIVLNPLIISRFHINSMKFYINKFEYTLLYMPNNNSYYCDQKNGSRFMANEQEVYDFLIEMISLKVKFE